MTQNMEKQEKATAEADQINESELKEVTPNEADIGNLEQDDNDSVNSNQQLEDSLHKIKELEDKLLRIAADAQNVKRRAEQDVQKAKNYSIESFAKDLLSVMDNLERTSKVISEDDADYEKFKPVLEGIEITKKELEAVFKRNGIQSVKPAIEEKFDHNLHQAMSQIEDSEKESGSIIDVMQTGYTMKDRLIRPALVIVVK